MNSNFSENALVEQPAIALFEELGYGSLNCYTEKVGAGATLGRETTTDVILWPQLKAAIETLNPGLPADAVQLAMEVLGRDRSAMGLAYANRDVMQLLKDGVKVTFQNDHGEDETETVQVIDWKTPTNNEFFLTSQQWFTGSVYKKRTASCVRHDLISACLLLGHRLVEVQ